MSSLGVNGPGAAAIRGADDYWANQTSRLQNIGSAGERLKKFVEAILIHQYFVTPADAKLALDQSELSFDPLVKNLELKAKKPLRSLSDAEANAMLAAIRGEKPTSREERLQQQRIDDANRGSRRSSGFYAGGGRSHGLKTKTLRRMLKKKGMKTTGKKATLLKRLTE